MKHPVAVAFLTGMSDALAEEVNNLNMAQGTAKQVMTFAMAIATERLKGNAVFGKKLEDFHEDGEAIQGMIVANKVHLQKWGDT